MKITKITGNAVTNNKTDGTRGLQGLSGAPGYPPRYNTAVPKKLNKPKEISYWNQEVGPTGKLITFGMLGFIIFMMIYAVLGHI